MPAAVDDDNTPVAGRRPDESAEVFWRKYNEAVSVGLTERDALAFAIDGDVSELRKLVDMGCPLELLPRIVC